jgi:flagellar biosynthesis/type III secretory pathway M-ring protein FliF/YscJ
MSATQIGIIAVALLIILGVLLLIWMQVVRNRTETEDHEPPESLQALKDARIDPGEKVATSISEEIESLVQAELSDLPDLANRKIDFSTAADDSLVIWLDGVAYHNVADIPDDRIRHAIQKAVDSFNKTALG